MPSPPEPAAPAPAGRGPTFADIYDQVVGRDFWGLWWRAFDRSVAAHGVRFDSVCEVACGTGEIALRFAAQGHEVSGVDISPDMIRVAREKCRGSGVRLEVQAMEELTLPEPVDLIVCCYDALNRLPTRAVLEGTLARFRAALTPGGHVVCDLATLRHLERDWGTGVRRAVQGGLESIWHTVWDPKARCLTVHLTARVPGPDGDPVPVTEHVAEYGHAKAAIESAAKGAGLAVVDVRDMLRWTRGEESSERLFYLLRAPA